MSFHENHLRNFLFSLSNFLAAFGGGMVLGKGSKAIDIPWLDGGTILAFLVGTVFGLGLLQIIPKKLSKNLSPYFSICGGVASICLLLIWQSFAVNNILFAMPGIIFFLLLSARFGFWFYSRVLRAANAAGQQQSIAWVEFGYYAGMVAGLIFWKFLHINISMLFVLLIDIIVQFTVGILDLLAIVQNRISSTSISSPTSTNSSIEKTPKNFQLWAWRLAGSVVFLTLGIQVVIFYIAHQFSENIGSYLLATFYAGVAFAAIFCRYFKIQLAWNINSNKLGFAKIQLALTNKSYHFSFLKLGILAMLSVATVIFATFEWNWGNEAIIANSKLLCLIFFVFLAAFIFEVLSLAILDRLGAEERLYNYSNMVIRTYGLMGVGAAACLWVFGVTNSSTSGLIFTIISCTLLCMLAVLKRKTTTLSQM